MQKPKIIILIGQTASGKTQTAIKLAKAINGEVISADSRQVYKHLNIGTDKVNKEAMQGVPHHLIDITDPVARGPLATLLARFGISQKSSRYTVSNFVYDAQAAIEDITSRGKVPIIAGGTMLYIDALMGNVNVPNVAPNPKLRAQLKQQSPALLFSKLQATDPCRAAQMVTEGQDKNPRRLIRALEIIDALGKVPENTQNNYPITKSHVGFGDWVMIGREEYDVLWLGLNNDPILQKEKINKRNAEMLENGLLEEVQQLQKMGISQEKFDTFGFEYKYPAMYLSGIPIIQNEVPTLEQVLMKMNSDTWRYAKKQRAWWQGRNEINWFKASEYENLLKKTQDFLTYTIP